MKNNSNTVEVKLLEDGIICAEWPLHALVSKSSMEDETNQRQALTNKPHALLVKLHGITDITEEAWEIISGDHFHSITTALAILYDEGSGYYEHGKIMVDLKFIDGKAVDYPVKYFDNEKAAINWLRSFL
jgi:hypothetical protein